LNNLATPLLLRAKVADRPGQAIHAHAIVLVMNPDVGTASNPGLTVVR
jgi:hypothetical protein